MTAFTIPVILKSFLVISGLFRLTSVVLLHSKIFGRFYFRTLFFVRNKNRPKFFASNLCQGDVTHRTGSCILIAITSHFRFLLKPQQFVTHALQFSNKILYFQSANYRPERRNCMVLKSKANSKSKTNS